MVTQCADRFEAIARLNDRARLGLDRTARIVITRGCLAAFCDLETIEALAIQAELLAAFGRCSFDPDCPLRDFAQITFRERRVWLKIDCYDLELEYGSPDPADAAVTTRVVTILLPEEY